MKTFVLQLVTLGVLLLLWQSVIVFGHINPLVIPSPYAVVVSVATHYKELLRETGVTILEAFLGFVSAAVIAYGTAILFVFLQPVEQAVMPYAIALKSTPLIAIAPLVVMWCGEGLASKIVMASLVAFWPILIGAVQGLRAVKTEALDLMASFGATKWQILTKVRIPSSAGYTFAALKIGSSLAVVGAVIAELVGSTRGIGHVINENSYYLHTDFVFAAVLFISSASILFYTVLAWIERQFQYWHERSIS